MAEPTHENSGQQRSQPGKNTISAAESHDGRYEEQAGNAYAYSVHDIVNKLDIHSSPATLLRPTSFASDSKTPAVKLLKV